MENIKLELSPLTALSPLDGRYSSKLDKLRNSMSEFGYLRFRVQVEITWLIALSKAGMAQLPPFSNSAVNFLQELLEKFSVEDAQAIKNIEKTTNHDVKAVEYWIKERIQTIPELHAAAEFVHFACTSEDINNTSHALQLKTSIHHVLLPSLTELCNTLRTIAHQHADIAMLSRTHGQTASPTTVGKEIANVFVRLNKAKQRIGNIAIMAKMNGAVGNYNAHLSAAPEIDWETFSQQLIEAPEPAGLGLTFQAYSTQIEPHDYMAEIFDAITHSNHILIDLCRDIWGYISLGYFKQKLKNDEVGSSTMPHKVNPIDFENAEGNLGVSNALLRHLSEKLPISRWQRDLTDSTVLRNMGVALGHTLLAHQSLMRGLGKLQVNQEQLEHDLNQAWEVLAEPIQTVMRRHKIKNAYEKLKSATRGKVIQKQDLHKLINSLDIPQAEKTQLLELTPASYIGKAAELARKI